MFTQACYNTVHSAYNIAMLLYIASIFAINFVEVMQFILFIVMLW